MSLYQYLDFLGGTGSSYLSSHYYRMHANQQMAAMQSRLAGIIDVQRGVASEQYSSAIGVSAANTATCRYCERPVLHGSQCRNCGARA